MKVIVFGNGRFAELAWYVLTHDSRYEVAAFTVDAAYMRGERLRDLPVVPFEEIAKRLPPDDHRLLVPLGYRSVNRLRAERYRQGGEMGYRFISWVSSRASVWPDLKVGENCMVYEHAVIQPFAVIGDNVIVRSGAHVSHHVRLGDHSFVSAHAALGGGAAVGEYCFVGLNATVRDNVTIAPRCVIAAGAVVTADTEENGVYMGVPARRHATPADQMKST
jgi:sugar O-acyltransferase (sialic acid O-acetyltransferase NeuD family)